MPTLTDRPVVGVDPETIETGTVQPPGDWVLIRLDPPIEFTKGGIVVPSRSRPVARTGVVVAIGEGCLSDDGHTRMPMSAVPGQRVLFERAAGKGLPRVPTETNETRWGYLLTRDGSICAIVAPEPTDPNRQRGLDAGAAGVPKRPKGGVPVSRSGHLTAERITPVQDWLMVLPDRREEEVSTSPSRKKAIYGARGKVLKMVEDNPEGRYDLWSAAVLARGPGLTTLTRCLDGDRIGRAPHLCEPGDRILYCGEPPWLQPLEELDPISAGAPMLIREHICVVSRLAG